MVMFDGPPITEMSCGAEFSVIVDEKGGLWSFGHPEYGQLGHNDDGKYIEKAKKVEYRWGSFAVSILQNVLIH